MALVLADRVQDTTTTTGTGTITLSGTPPVGYQAFSVIGNGNTTYYTIAGTSEWEVGIGTYTAAGTTLARTTVLASSNAGALVNFSAGSKDVFVTHPASADTSLTTAISTEASTRASADTSVATAVSTEASTRVSADSSLTTAVSTEVSSRTSAGASLTTAISTETSSRVSFDTSLTTAVSSEVSTRASQSTSLNTAVSSEVSTRTSQSTSLNTAVSSEASTRASVDTSITTAYQSADTSLTTAVSTGNSTRLSADNSLATAINAVGGGGYIDLTATAASAPSTNITRLEREIFANQNIVKLLSNGFGDVTLQNDISRKNWGMWRKQANSTTDVLAGNMSALTLSGATASAIGVGGASTFFNRQNGVNYASAATAGSVCHLRWQNNNIFIGNGSIGGFVVKMRLGCNDAASVSGARQFYGVSSNYSTGATDVEPSTLLNSIGVGHGTADTNLKLYWGGSTAQTPVDLGANFPANTLGVDMYDIIISNPAALANTVYVTVIRYSNTTGLEIYRSNQTLTGTAGTAIPTNASGMTPFWGYRSNNATALAVRTDLVSIYYEADI